MMNQAKENLAKMPEEAPEAQQPPVKYKVDEGWFVSHGRSFEHMIEARVQGLDIAEKATKKKGKAASKAGVTLEDLAKIEGWVSPNLPVLEAVFRLLLVHQNKPMDVEQISQELAEHGIGVMDSRVINPVVLTRMLDQDFHYGIVRHTEEELAQDATAQS